MMGLLRRASLRLRLYFGFLSHATNHICGNYEERDKGSSVVNCGQAANGGYKTQKNWAAADTAVTADPESGNCVGQPVGGGLTTGNGVADGVQHTIAEGTAHRTDNNGKKTGRGGHKDQADRLNRRAKQTDVILFTLVFQFAGNGTDEQEGYRVNHEEVRQDNVESYYII